MKGSICIVSGKKGYHLKVNNLYISHGFNDVKAIKSEYGIPYGATEWISVKAIRNFWAKYMTLAIHATKNPHKSVWGQLQFIPE